MSQKQSVLRLLSDRKPHTHHELYALGCVAHSRISDLRKDGYRIEQWREGDHYLYQLTGSLDEATTWASAPKDSPGSSPPGLSVVASSSVSNPAADDAADDHQASRDGTLLLFECVVDESAGLRGAYGNEAA